MKKHFFLVAFILLYGIMQAQNNLNGVIIDQKNKKPIPGVTIYIENSNAGTVSDMNGQFALKNIPNKTCTLTVAFTGYITQKIIINVENRNQFRKIFLHEQVLELEEVIISTPFNKLQSENVVKVDHKNLTHMKKRGSLNLMDAVSQVAGVSAINTGFGITKPVIRGLSANRVVVYNQGMQVENFQSGEKHGLGINESGIESVEVIKGPASLLYGSDAIGGVLYLIPEKFATSGEIKTNLRTQYDTSTSGINTSLGAKTSRNKWQFLARGALGSHADYKVPNGMRLTNSRFNDKDIKTGVGFTSNSFSSEIRYNYNNSLNGIPHDIEPDEQDTSHKIHELHQNIKNQVITNKTKWNIQNSKLVTNVGYTHHKRILQEEDIQKIGMNLKTLTYDAKWYFPKWNDLEVIAGAQGLFQTNTNFGVGRFLPDASVNNLGFFTNVRYQYKNWAFQTGARYDIRNINTEDIGEIGQNNYRVGFDKDLESFTGSFGFKSALTDRFTFRLNTAKGFRSPNLAELASKGVHEGRIEIGNSDLKNESNWQSDLSIEYSNTHIEFFGNIFHNSINNYIYIAPTETTQNEFEVYQYQQDNAALYGGEVGLHLHPHPLDWLHIESSYEMVIGQREDKSYLPLIPANQWKNKIRFSKENETKLIKYYYFNIAVNHTFKAEKIDEYENSQNAYTLFNPGLGGTVMFGEMNLDVNVSIHNLLNKEYISHLSVLREHGVPNSGRNIIFSINLDI